MKTDVWRIVSAIFMLVAGTVLSYRGFFLFSSCEEPKRQFF